MLLGATAIEDKLQEGVPETIANLAESGIKIWVLTGDKKDTAINIGFSCHLLQPHYRLIVVDAADWHSTQLQMRDALDRYIRAPDRSPEQIFALVIEGQTLHHALEPENRLHLLALATACKAVICCRVSPKQKAEVVELVKKTLGKVCLSIGDGANDVSMIREAHIGVGISGHEGRQAVMGEAWLRVYFFLIFLLVSGRLCDCAVSVSGAAAAGARAVQLQAHHDADQVLLLQELRVWAVPAVVWHFQQVLGPDHVRHLDAGLLQPPLHLSPHPLLRRPRQGRPPQNRKGFSFSFLFSRR
jgi:soluble P-type ATPase